MKPHENQENSLGSLIQNSEKTIKKFYEQCHHNKDLAVLNISMDLPFAAGRFCKTEALENVQTFSAFRSDFGKDYGVLLTDGPLNGILTRAVVLLDENNRVLYTELVPEITQEPNYGAVEEVLKS